MYGVGVVLVLVWHHLLGKFALPRMVHLLVLGLGAYFLIAGVEYLVGTLHLAWYGERYWNYGSSFTLCPNPSFTCWLPTSVFAMIAVFAVYVVQPYVEIYTMMIPRRWILLIVLLMLLNVVLTYRGVLI